jgi:hypothetical protein
VRPDIHEKLSGCIIAKTAPNALGKAGVFRDFRETRDIFVCNLRANTLDIEAALMPWCGSTVEMSGFVDRDLAYSIRLDTILGQQWRT